MVNAIKGLELAGKINASSPISLYLATLQSLIWKRENPFFIQHLQAHSGLPGPMSAANAEVDATTRRELIFSAICDTPTQLAARFHNTFHVNAKTLQVKFGLSREAARQIVVHCPDCAIHIHPMGIGVNPKGLLPLDLWQMDVTHFSEFGKLKYIHVSVDTCSGLKYTTPLTGKKSPQCYCSLLGNLGCLG